MITNAAFAIIPIFLLIFFANSFLLVLFAKPSKQPASADRAAFLCRWGIPAVP